MSALRQPNRITEGPDGMDTSPSSLQSDVSIAVIQTFPRADGRQR